MWRRVLNETNETNYRIERILPGICSILDTFIFNISKSTKAKDLIVDQLNIECISDLISVDKLYEYGWASHGLQN